MQTTDNNQGKTLFELLNESESAERAYSDLSHIANIPLKELAQKHPSLLVFPKVFGEINDDIDELPICNLSGANDKPNEAKLSTGNLMGFVGYGNTQLSITSRFAVGAEDYFLHYMLQKVFCSHLVDMNHFYDKSDSEFDFMIYLFPMMLRKALAQGLFKTYEVFKRNDTNVKGAIDVPRHIAKNVPFAGRIAYSTRERSFDNSVTELIRHTIELIKAKPNGKTILTSNAEVKSAVQTIMEATPLYNYRDREKVISKNIKPVNHPYFTAYKPLQKLCLAILRYQKLKYKTDSKQVYGILFDGSWLWEEYLWTLLEDKGYKHPRNKENAGGIKMFDNDADWNNFDKNHRKIYPDFYKPNECILDAKYKRLNNGVGREDLYQIVTYMHTMKIDKGGFIYPYSPTVGKSEQNKRWPLANDSGTISVIGFPIPQIQGEKKDKEFRLEIKKSEDEFLKIAFGF